MPGHRDIEPAGGRQVRVWYMQGAKVGDPVRAQDPTTHEPGPVIGYVEKVSEANTLLQLSPSPAAYTALGRVSNKTAMAYTSGLGYVVITRDPNASVGDIAAVRSGPKRP
jgi:hypothetical protein